MAVSFAEYIKEKKVLCDGGFGTYFAALTGSEEPCEKANLERPEFVKKIHREYIQAGARFIRTNTFAANRKILSCNDEKLVEVVKAGYRLAKEVADEALKDGKEPVYVSADIGPVSGGVVETGSRETEYLTICNAFLEEGADIFVFETFSNLDEILSVIKKIKRENPHIFIITQFCVNQFGYSNAGLSAKRLLEEAGNVDEIDAVGFNCGVGPGHLFQILEKQNLDIGKFITAFPNAGYPQMIQSRLVFLDNEEYFVEKGFDIAGLHVDMLGGCCGTTPSYISKLSKKISWERSGERIPQKKTMPALKIKSRDYSFFGGKEKKLIAVELAPPLDANDEKIMDAANRLKNCNVDVLTFPDSPSGRTRVDPVLMAAKVMNETGMCVMPHICCRDKNAIAMRSQLLGAQVNGIHNFLVITGDPVPSMVRQSVKSVFNFDSVGLMKIIKDMNEETFAEEPLFYGGAINYNRRNLDVECGRLKKKTEAGATFFFTQPLFCKEDVEKVRSLKKEVPEARILCGIMPLISKRNALFMKNEMVGIHVPEDIIERYDENMTKEQGESVGIAIAKEVMELAADFADGFYFSLPFNRVNVLESILEDRVF